MEFSEALEKAEGSKEFKEWRKKNKEMYLVHGFTMLNSSKEEPMNWQIGYYDKKDDKITPVEVGADVSIGEPQQIFKKDGNVSKLDSGKVRIKLSRALAENEKVRLEKYAKDQPMKIFVVVQNIDDFGDVLNITTATNTMNTINVKIDAENGKVKSVKTENFMQMQ
jgi:hypothetical protein